jgi:hypothetical protein
MLLESLKKKPVCFWFIYLFSVGSLQRMQHKLLDNFFSVLSCVVSVPFYTGFLPLLFWVCPVSCGTLTTSSYSASVTMNCSNRYCLQSGHGKLARQMTLLMAFSDYLGNVVKVFIYLPQLKSGLFLINGRGKPLPRFKKIKLCYLNYYFSVQLV